MRIAIYTAIFGDKDEIKEPVNFQKTDYVDYFLITDSETIKSVVYQIVYKKTIYDDITKNARYYKINGLEIFENYDIVVWHDANLQIKHDKIISLINIIKNKEITLFIHPERKCIYDEAIKCIELEKDFPFKILKQIFFYFKNGTKNNVGLYATGLLITNKKLIHQDFLNLWWSEIKNKSRRDQLSLPYALAKFNIQPNLLIGDVRNNEYLLFHKHKHNKYNVLSKVKLNSHNTYLKYITIKMIQILKKINF